MTKYKVTTELKTPWYLKLLRLLRIKKPIECLSMYSEYDLFRKGDILNMGESVNVLVLSKEKE